MTTNRYMDIVGELIEVCVEHTCDVKQQLRFYGASVYKKEIVYIVNRKINNIKTIVSFLDAQESLQAIKKFASSQIVSGNVKVGAIGSFEQKVEKLICEVVEGLDAFVTEIKENPKIFLKRDIRRELKRSRKHLMGACRRGSRTRQLLQTI